MKKSYLSAALLVILGGSAFAQTEKVLPTSETKYSRENPGYFQLDPATIKVEEIFLRNKDGFHRAAPATPAPAAEPANSAPAAPSVPAGQQIDNALVIIEKVINTGQKVFNVIAANKPVVDITVNYANAIPQGITHWTQMQGWQMPLSKTFRLTAKNVLGATVVDVKYQVLATYGGNYKGKGQYLTGVSVQPLAINVGWGYTLNYTCEVPDSTVSNAGTEENPLAAMNLILKWKVSTALKEMDGRDVYYVRGDGRLEQMGSPFKGEKLERSLKTIKTLGK